MLASYRGLRRYPYGREGGLMKLVAEVVGVEGDERTIGGAIYLTDPVDPSSIFPEAVALKRQCVIHGKPFLSTVASARDWIEMERIHAGLPRDADRKSTRLNSSHLVISYAVFCLKKKKTIHVVDRLRVADDDAACRAAADALVVTRLVGCTL